MLVSYASLAHARAEWLVLLLPVAFVVGEFLTRLLGIERLFTNGNARIARLGRKLDRTRRGTATLVYRGMVAVAMLVIPAMLFGAVLSQPAPPVQLAALILLVLWFGHAFAMQSGWKLWQRAVADTTPLELPHRDYLFADSHAVLRYSIVTRAEFFATGIVGASFWYVIGAWPLMAAYLALACATTHFHGAAFGWAARSLFALMDFVPRLIARTLFAVAGLFTPQVRPFALFLRADWRSFVAHLFNIALGGPTPEGEMPWVGEGTARLTPQHLRRFLVLTGTASILLVLLLASPMIYNILTKLI